MWISFTALTALITILFWLILSSSVRLNYTNENIEDIDRMMWQAMGQYTSDEFYEHLSVIASGGNCLIQILDEKTGKTLYTTVDSEEKEQDIFSYLIDENIFELLDDNGGEYTYRVENASENSEWVVHAMVIANIEGSRQVMIFCKSLISVDHLLVMFGRRVIYAFIVILLIASVLSYMITRVITKPIHRLTEKAGKLAEGDYDVTFSDEGCYEVRKLSDTLGLAAKEFNETEQMRKEFIANISHDMRTPLTVIKMYTEMIQTMSGDNPQKRAVHLERIQSEVDKMSTLITDFMDLAKLQSGVLQVEKKRFNLSVLIQDVVATFEMRHQQDDFIIEANVAERAFVCADQKMIYRVIENFMTNAEKFSVNEKKIELMLTSEKNIVRLEVKDYGPGIEKEHLAYIWDRYYKVDPYGNNKTGTGLGLNIASQILKIHDAKYGVESEVGQGSTFWFELEAVE